MLEFIEMDLDDPGLWEQMKRLEDKMRDFVKEKRNEQKKVRELLVDKNVPFN